MNVVVSFPGGGVRLDRPVRLSVGQRGSEALKQAGELLGLEIEAALVRGEIGTHPARAQPTLCALWFARLADAVDAGFVPVACCGHSAGDWTAALAAGALGLEDALQLLMLRGQLIEKECGLQQGTMLMLVGPPPAEVEAYIQERRGVWIAAYNGRRCVTLSIEAPVLAQFEAAIENDKFGQLTRLEIPFASHTVLMSAVANGLAQAVKQHNFEPPRFSLYSCSTGQKLDSPSKTAQALARNVERPVLWSKTIAEVQADYPDTPHLNLMRIGGMSVLLREGGVATRSIIDFETESSST